MGWSTDGDGNIVWVYNDWESTRLYDADVTSAGPSIYEVNGSRQENYTPTEFSAHIEYICPWVDRFNYATAVAQSVYNAYPPLDSDGNIVASRLSYFGTYYPAVVTQISIAPLGPEGGNIETVNGPLTFQPYTIAKLAVDYKGLIRCGNVSLQETVTPAFSMRQLPSWGYYWRTDGAPVLDNESPAIQEVKVTLQRHLQGVRRIPQWFYDLSGCVNTNPWMDMVTKISYLPGTLLFIPSSMERNVTMARDDDDCIWNLSYEIQWDPVGWNLFRRPHGVDCMMSDGSPVYLYPEKHFPALLVDPNAVQAEQMLGDPYRVHLVDETGYGYTIGVQFDGTVILLGSDS